LILAVHWIYGVVSGKKMTFLSEQEIYDFLVQ
jgi:hypothetical protein